MGCLRKQILKVALKNFANVDFIAMNLRSNGKSMCFPSGSQFNGPHNALHTHTHTRTRTLKWCYISPYIVVNQSESQLMFYLALDTLKTGESCPGTKKLAVSDAVIVGNSIQFIAHDPHYL